MRELGLGQELGDRRAHLPALVVDEVREALRPPLLRELLEPVELRARERFRRRDVANGLGAREDAELGAARELGGVLDLEPEAEIRLVRAVARHDVVPGEARERPRRRRALERLEGRDDGLLQDVEHVLALDERHLDVELAELELPVGAQILVPPAGGDLVVAVEAADHEELLEHLRRLGQREEAARLEARPGRGSRGRPRASP